MEPRCPSTDEWVMEMWRFDTIGSERVKPQGIGKVAGKCLELGKSRIG